MNSLTEDLGGHRSVDVRPKIGIHIRILLLRFMPLKYAANEFPQILNTPCNLKSKANHESISILAV